MFPRAAAASVILFISVAAAAMASGEVTGAGATFPFPLYMKWASAYRTETGVEISYQGIGSGAGIKLIEGNSVTFGASDMPLKASDLDQFGLVQFPTVVGGDVPVVNLPGIKAGELTLNGATLAAIYLGKISNWSDPALRRLNPGIVLPDRPINVVHRSDGSGTTFVWANFLSDASVEWKTNVGASTIVDWPIGLGANGNEGVAATVMQLPDSIGYVEYAFATARNLAFTKVVNPAGTAVLPSLDSFRAAADSADWMHAPAFNVVLTNQPGLNAWPITGATFILMHKHPADAAASAKALRFFKWTYEKGGPMALQLSYVPIPAQVVQQVEASWRDIQPPP